MVTGLSGENSNATADESHRTQRPAFETAGGVGPSILIGVTIDASLKFHAGLATILASRGWTVHIVASAGPVMVQLSHVRGVHTHVIPMERVPSPLKDVLALVRWIRLLRKTKPAIVIAGTPKAGLLGIVASRLVKVPHRIYVMHGLRLETIRGVKAPVFRLMEWLTCRGATQVIAVSKSLMQRAIEWGLVAPSRITVLGHGSADGVEIERFASIATAGQLPALRERLNLDPGLPIIGFVGRLTRDKGLPELAEALRLLRDRGVVLQLLVVGATDDTTGLAAAGLLEASRQRIVSVGFVEDPAPYFALMDVFCLPSLREGLGSVVLEAMASRVPVVVTDATGLVDLVEDGVTGTQIPRRNGLALANAISSTLHDPVRSRLMADAAFAMVEEKFEAVSVQERFVTFIETFRCPGRP